MPLELLEIISLVAVSQDNLWGYVFNLPEGVFVIEGSLGFMRVMTGAEYRDRMLLGALYKPGCITVEAGVYEDTGYRRLY